MRKIFNIADGAEDDEIIEEEEMLVELGDDMYNPMVNYTKKIRKTNIPSSTVLLIKIMTINTLEY